MVEAEMLRVLATALGDSQSQNAQLKQDIAQIRSDKEEAERRCRVLEESSRFRGLSEENEMNRKLMEENSRLERDIAQIRLGKEEAERRYRVLEESYRGLSEKDEGYRKVMEENDKQKQEIHQVSMERHNLLRRIEILEQELATPTERIQYVFQAEEDWRNIRYAEELAIWERKLEDQQASSAAEIAALKAQHEREGYEREEIFKAELQHALSPAEARINDMRTALQDEQAETKRLETENMQLKDRNDRLMRLNLDTQLKKDERLDISFTAKAMRIQLANLKAERDELKIQSTIDTMVVQLGNLEAEHQNLFTQRDDLRKALLECTKNVTFAQDRMSAMHFELEEFKSKNAKMQEDMRRMKQLEDRMRSPSKNMSRPNSQDQAEATKKEVTQLKQELSDLKAEYQNIKNDTEKTAATALEDRDALWKAHDRCKRLEEELRLARAQMNATLSSPASSRRQELFYTRRWDGERGASPSPLSPR